MRDRWRLQSLGMVLVTALSLCPVFSQEIPAPAPNAEAAFLEELPVVEAAALRQQTLEEAPANVTVVTAADIRQRGYRTLADVLAGVRGFYVTNDRFYRYVGTRGLSIPGDFNTRFLVMLNGNPLTENVYNSNGFFGQDFGLDLDLVQRIEIIRGPSSALYGSNGILANINIITKSPVDHPSFSASTELGSFGYGKAQVATSQYLGRGVNLLLSFSGFHTKGQSLYFPDYDAGETNDGWADRVDNERGYHSFAQLMWGNWSATAYFNSRQIQIPVGMFGSVFNDPGNSAQDQRNFLGLNYTRNVGETGKLRWRLNYDQYRYHDRFHYRDVPADPTVTMINDNYGDWLSSQISYSRPLARIGEFTIGGSGSFELRNQQLYYQTQPAYNPLLRIDQPDQRGAVFAMQEWEFLPRWTAHFGLRYDYSRNFKGAASPRLALVRKQSPRTTYKAVYAYAFRNPSAYEMFYDDPNYMLANPYLRQERAHTFEGIYERNWGARAKAVVNAFH